MRLPKNEVEERAIEKFLDYYTQANKTSYVIKQWLDRGPQSGRGPTPDCLCVDPPSGNEMVVEHTMLTGGRDLKLTQGAEQFLLNSSYWR